MTIRNARKIKVGQWVRVNWDDVGARDGIVIERDYSSLKVFEPFGECRWVEANQIIGVGDSITARSSGIK